MKKTGGSVEFFSEDEDVLVYHYGPPGERLKNAPDVVKKFYSGESPQPPKGFFQSLVHTKSSRFLLFTIVAVLAIIGVSLVIGNGSSSATIDGVTVTLNAFMFEECVYVSLKFSEAEEYLGVLQPVSATVKALIAENQIIYTQDIEEIYSGKELFLRTIFNDYDIISVEADVTVKENPVTLQCQVSRN